MLIKETPWNRNLQIGEEFLKCYRNLDDILKIICSDLDCMEYFLKLNKQIENKLFENYKRNFEEPV